jgi:hypothetical protein
MMFRPRILLAFLAGAAAVGAASTADAMCCCPVPCAAPPVAPVAVYQPYELPQIYVVDQGPVYSGPGIYTNPTLVLPRPMPPYPYVDSDYPAYPPAYYGPPRRHYGPILRSRAQGVLPRGAVRGWQRR